MELTYKGATLPADLVDRLVKEAGRLNVPPSYLITKLHFEGLWGRSEVARANNNWAGMTWAGDPNRPSGVVVRKGTARPANEGGHYMAYDNLDDFIKDWTYLIRPGGIYQVANSQTFSDAVKGIFRVGGAQADYATMNVNDSQERYELYLERMLARRTAINQANNGALDTLDKTEGGYTMTTAKKILDTARSQLGVTKLSGGHKAIINKYNATKPLPVGYAVTYADDWCDAFVTWVAITAGATDLIGRECGVERHKNIFKQKGIWKGLVRPKAGDIVIFEWNGNRYGFAHHIGYVESVNGDRITTIEGNTTIGGVSQVGRQSYAWNSAYIQGYARPAYSDGEVSKPLGKKTIADHAKKWQTGQGIDDKVKGKTFDVVAEKKVRQSKSRKAYLLHDGRYYIGWLLEQDTIDFKPYKSDLEVAKEVLDGKWGNNPERAKKLSEAGYIASDVQAEVNKLIKERDASAEIEEIAPAPSEEQPAGGDEPELADNEVILDGIVYQIIKK